MSDLDEQRGRTLSLAEHWLDVGRPERCLEVLRAGDEATTTPRAFELRAAALLRLDRDAEAIAEARRGLSVDPDNVSLLTLMGIACRATGAFADGEQALLAALRIDPEEPYVLGHYALLLATAGQVDKAARVAEAAARLDPDHTVVRHARSLIAHLQGRDDAAAAIAREGLSDDAEDLSSHALLGAYSLEEGRVVDGARHWRTAASVRPEGDIAEAAREAAVFAHPALAPLRFTYRWGPAKVWIAALVIIGGLTLLGQDALSTVAGLTYLTFVVYSWVAPPVVKAWLRRRR